MKKKQLKKSNRLNLLDKIKSIRFSGFLQKTNSAFKQIFSFIDSWWRVILVGFFLIIFLYYPIGGMMMHNINRNTTVEINHKDSKTLSSIDTMSYIINSEVNENFWTPNLPFFFPSYFLDNMPNFQMGKIAALSKFASALDSRVGVNQDSNLNKAAELLQYPGTIWMFSPDNKITPVPSAGTQYRKADKHLKKYNEKIAASAIFFVSKPEDLSYLLKVAAIDLHKSTSDLETQIREHSSSTLDFKADDIFYYNQGKIYSYFLLFKSLSYDYKDTIVNSNLYPAWIKMLKALEDGSKLNPWIVKNGNLDSAFSSNHLNYLAFYSLKSANQMQNLALKIDQLPN